MATLTPQERLQPALLDRLTDDEPDKQIETRESRLISVQRLRAAVLRDLAWLLNASAPMAEALDPSEYPEAAKSVLGFGVPPTAGTTASGIDRRTLEKTIVDAITRFEPRLMPDSLRIQAMLSTKSLDHHNQIQIDIRGSLWAVPVPIELLLRTDIDLESGQVDVRDASS